jgi:hypothetical protein
MSSPDATLDLPASIAAYIAAANRRDAAAAARCFTARAVVRDEGQTIEGRAQIARWVAETGRKYGHTIEPLAVAREGGRVVVTNRLTGNFPGSPIEVRFYLGLDGDEIATLEIR